MVQREELTPQPTEITHLSAGGKDIDGRSSQEKGRIILATETTHDETTPINPTASMEIIVRPTPAITEARTRTTTEERAIDLNQGTN